MRRFVDLETPALAPRILRDTVIGRKGRAPGTVYEATPTRLAERITPGVVNRVRTHVRAIVVEMLSNRQPVPTNRQGQTRIVARAIAKTIAERAWRHRDLEHSVLDILELGDQLRARPDFAKAFARPKRLRKQKPKAIEAPVEIDYDSLDFSGDPQVVASREIERAIRARYYDPSRQIGRPGARSPLLPAPVPTVRPPKPSPAPLSPEAARALAVERGLVPAPAQAEPRRGSEHQNRRRPAIAPTGFFGPKGTVLRRHSLG
jgi:hypothetical protein